MISGREQMLRSFIDNSMEEMFRIIKINGGGFMSDISIVVVTNLKRFQVDSDFIAFLEP